MFYRLVFSQSLLSLDLIEEMLKLSTERALCSKKPETAATTDSAMATAMDITTDTIKANIMASTTATTTDSHTVTSDAPLKDNGKDADKVSEDKKVLEETSTDTVVTPTDTPTGTSPKTPVAAETPTTDQTNDTSEMNHQVWHKNVDYFRMDGSCVNKKRHEYISEFNDENDRRFVDD